MAALLLIPGRNHRLIKWVALVAALASLAFSVLVMVGYDPAGAEFQFREDIPWIDAFGIRYTLGPDYRAIFDDAGFCFTEAEDITAADPA